MKLKSGIKVLFLLSIGISLVGCCTPEVKTEYVYQTPVVSYPSPTAYPDVTILYNEDLVRYKELCKVKIDKCNIDKETLYKQATVE